MICMWLYFGVNIMEVKITELFKEKEGFSQLSGSVFELGDNAAKITWDNCLDKAEEEAFLISLPEEIAALKRFILDTGGWDTEEIDSWSLQELNALFIQLIAGDVRESEGLTNEDWELYEKEIEVGRVAGYIFKGIDKEIYYTLD